MTDGCRTMISHASRPSKRTSQVTTDQSRPIAAHPYLTAVIAGGAALGLLAIVNNRFAANAERRNPPLGKFVEVHGVRLHYVERGSGQALVLLHGNGSMIQDFASSGIIDMASKSHRVIVFDRPGFGHSERPREVVWTAAAQSELIEAALRKIGITSAAVLGHSWGCSVAVALALRAPALVRSLVLVSGYYYPTVRTDVVTMSVPALPGLGDLIRYTLSPLVARMMWPLLKRRIFGPAPTPQKFEVGYPEEMAFRPSQIRASAAESALMIPGAFAARRHYKQITQPVVIVAGEEDRLIDIDDQSARLHSELHNSTLHRVPGAGHMVHQTTPAVILGAIAEADHRAAA